MIDFPDISLKLGYYANEIIRFLARTLEGFFDFIFFVFSRTINGIDDFLMWIPWFVFILIIFLLGWYFQSILSGLMYAVFIFLIGSFDLWDEMMMTIAIIITAVVISLSIGIPTGV